MEQHFSGYDGNKQNKYKLWVGMRAMMKNKVSGERVNFYVRNFLCLQWLWVNTLIR